MDYYILVTGASSGIGEQACKLFTSLGYHVLAGVRKTGDGETLATKYGNHLHPVLMDVTAEDQLLAAKESVEKMIGEGALVAIINNAGIAVHGAVLYIPLQAWRNQFEINLMGAIRVTQLFFPLLIRPGKPADLHPRRIVNISSVSGLFASPFLAPYVASKYALEAMSDSLRRELYMYDVQVVLIEPGNIRTPMWVKAKTDTTYFGPEYESIISFKDRIIDKNIEEAFDLSALDPVFIKAVKGQRVRPRYLIRPNAWKFNLIRRLPASWIDRMIRKKLQSRSGIRPF